MAYPALMEEFHFNTESGQKWTFIFDGYCFDYQIANCVNAVFEIMNYGKTIGVALKVPDMIWGKRHAVRTDIYPGGPRAAQERACRALAEYVEQRRSERFG